MSILKFWTLEANDTVLKFLVLKRRIHPMSRIHPLLRYGDSELKSAISDSKEIGSLTQMLYELDIHEALPLVANIGDLAASTAITSVACDKSFSVLRRIKCYQDPKIGQSNS